MQVKKYNPKTYVKYEIFLMNPPYASKIQWKQEINIIQKKKF